MPRSLALSLLAALPILAIAGPAFADDASQVEKIADNHYRLPGELLDALLKDPKEASRAMRVIPDVRGGERLGFKVFGIRPGSLAQALGLRNGDRVMLVNHRKLGDMKRAAQILGEAGRYDRMVLTVERRDKRFDLTWELRGEGREKLPKLPPKPTLTKPRAPVSDLVSEVRIRGRVKAKMDMTFGEKGEREGTIDLTVPSVTLIDERITLPEGPALNLGTLDLGKVRVVLRAPGKQPGTMVIDKLEARTRHLRLSVLEGSVVAPTDEGRMILNLRVTTKPAFFEAPGRGIWKTRLEAAGMDKGVFELSCVGRWRAPQCMIR